MYPQSITVDISGYGEAGPPYDKMKAYDLLVQAESGLTSITGSPEESGRVGISICDLTTGLNAYTAVLEALIERSNTGRGTCVKASLFASMADWLASPLIAYEQSKTIRPRNALRHPLMCPYGAFSSNDGSKTLVACQNEREWVRFCEYVLEDSDFAGHPQAAGNVGRVEHRAFIEGRGNNRRHLARNLSRAAARCRHRLRCREHHAGPFPPRCAAPDHRRHTERRHRHAGPCRRARQGQRRLRSRPRLR